MRLRTSGVIQDSNEGNSDEHSFKGIVAPARSYDIAPPFDGQVIEIDFKPGEYVEKGKLLFTLDTTKEELELERDKAQLLRAEAQLRIAEVTLKKNQELCKRTSYQSCTAWSWRRRGILPQRRSPKPASKCGATKSDHGDEAIRAVFCVMSRSAVAEGAHLSEQTSMATISELDPILIKAYVPYQVYAEHLQLLEPGETFDRSNALGGMRSSSRYQPARSFLRSESLPEADTNLIRRRRSWKCWWDVPDPNLPLRPGLAVTSRCEAQTRIEARIVPLALQDGLACGERGI